MKRIFIKISSFILAFLVLFSTFSFTVEKHYCGDSLIEVSYLGEIEVCDMSMDNVDITKVNSCCKDEIHKIEGQDTLRQTQVDDFDLSKQQFLASLYISYNNLFVEKTAKKTNYKDFSPPGVLSDYQVLYQTFLI